METLEIILDGACRKWTGVLSLELSLSLAHRAEPPQATLSLLNFSGALNLTAEGNGVFLNRWSYFAPTFPPDLLVI